MRKLASVLLPLTALGLVGCGSEPSLPSEAPTAALSTGATGPRATNGHCTGTYEVGEAINQPPPNEDKLSSLAVTVTATCELGHLGRATMSSQELLVFDENDAIHVTDAPVTLTAVSGDKLYLLESDVFGDFFEDGRYEFTGTWTVTGGTGRFSAASGNLAITGGGNTGDLTTNRAVRGWLAF
jgi:hypothetical protein